MTPGPPSPSAVARPWIPDQGVTRPPEHDPRSTTFGVAEPTWEIGVDGKPPGALPVKAKASQRFTIHDGVVVPGRPPVPATDWGATRGRPSEGDTQEFEHRTTRPPVIDNYNLKKDAPLPEGDGSEADRTARTAALSSRWPTPRVPDVRPSSRSTSPPPRSRTKFRRRQGPRRSEICKRQRKRSNSARTTTYKEGDTLDKGFAYRRRERASGRTWRRGSSVTPASPSRGTTGRLAKNGAVLRSEPGRMAYLQAWPPAGVFAGYNPCPTRRRGRSKCPAASAWAPTARSAWPT